MTKLGGTQLSVSPQLRRHNYCLPGFNIQSHHFSLIALNYMPLWFEYFHDHLNPFDDTEPFSLNKDTAEVVQGLNLPLLQGV